MRYSSFSRGALILALVLAPAWGLCFWLAYLVTHFSSVAQGSFSNFYTYRTDAMNAFTHGWAAYYGSGDLNINPPLQGLILFPFLPFPYPLAFLFWTLLLLACMFLTWRLLAARRLWLLPVLLLLFPVLDALRLGQVVILVVAIVTLAWWLSEHGHGFSAGTILALATLKPQLILLLPPVLLLTHHRREFLGFVAGSTAIGLLSFALVGTKGIAAMLANQQDTLSNPAQFHIDNSMVLRLWWPGTPGLLLVIAVLILTLGLAWRHRASPPSAIYAIGILGSLLVAPYFHVQDLVLWIPAALLMQRSVGLPRPVAVLGLIFASLPIFGAPLVTLLALLFFFRPVLLHPEATNNPIRPTPSLVGVQQPI